MILACKGRSISGFARLSRKAMGPGYLEKVRWCCKSQLSKKMGQVLIKIREGADLRHKVLATQNPPSLATQRESTWNCIWSLAQSASLVELHRKGQSATSGAEDERKAALVVC